MFNHKVLKKIVYLLLTRFEYDFYNEQICFLIGKSGDITVTALNEFLIFLNFFRLTYHQRKVNYIYF